ncbi:inositol-3-phosphate synthase [Phorcysia thermohydrogeniphila]|uniref:Myo-inositol-1-phosphate synthase n=1 Tax=Phorcysia thermohydrogeniphila TaxID=936138 RepID=A0A4R1GB45_9BACT|nr:inositol-3-phosphate synthase [Phorcysia thermohydrogeniphila]TCK03911.1 myo-inositol-1-phosphate synthase [Phorcysia thermohydrogeniphila]
MSEKVKVAIVGVGNCASSLIQGIYYYRNKSEEEISGLMHYDIGGYKPWDIEVVAAFDIDVRKVGKDVSKAIFEKPNCTTVFCPDVPEMGVEVQMGPIMDGFAEHMKDYPEDQRFVPADKEPVDVVKVLKESGAEVVINYLPVGSEEATRFYAQCALEAGCAFVNCIPVFIASDEEWAKKFREKGLPIVGDDIKSQVGATITHRVLATLMSDRGVRIDRTYQLNFGGNTDFLNMLERKRLKTKKVSKTEAVRSLLPYPIESDNIHIGPSDYVPWLKDNKIAYIRLEGRLFGDVPMYIELKLSVEDSPNSAGSAIDAIRCAKLALDRGIAGPLYSISAYTMKHPPVQYPDWKAKELVDKFIKGEVER